MRAAVPRSGLGLLFVLSLALLLVEPGRVPLFEPDEGRYAEIPREMLGTGDFVTPRLNGVVYFEKPPLYYWAVAASMSIFGENELAARAPTKLASVLLALLPYLFLRRRESERTALLAGLIVASSGLVLVLVRVSLIDPAVSCALSAAVFFFVDLQQREGLGDGKAERRALFGLHVACAAAVMLKGLIGLILPGGAILVFLIITRRWSLFPRLFSPGPLSLFLVLALPWHVLVASRNPGFFDFYIVHEQLLRFATTVHQRTGHPLFFVPVVLGGFLPWTALAGCIRHTWPGRALTAWRDRERSAEVFLWIYAILVFLFFSASSSKLVPYIQPIWPALGVLLAIGIERAAAQGADFVRERRFAATIFGVLFTTGMVYAVGRDEATQFGLAGSAIILLTGLLSGVVANVANRGMALVTGIAVPWMVFHVGALAALPGVARHITPWPVVDTVLREVTPDDVVVQRGHYLEVLPFYLKRLTPVAHLEKSELDFGRTQPHAPGLFPSEEDFVKLWQGEKRVLAVVHRDHVVDFRKLGLSSGRVLAIERSGKHLLIANR